ncbi:DNA-directed RNA polymerase core subunit rpc10 [Ascosphaera acerosa]|nr:DNA-directed RNA polymerase core subunit rpc10 [Ascosphaera acerosa]
MSSAGYQINNMASQSGYTEGSTSDNVVCFYICGECSARIQLRRSDAIRCKECGHRVLYKERTPRMVQFQAR